MANLYQGVAFSPQTTLSENIGAADTIIKVSDSSVFPDPPNYATIGTDELGETIEYAAKAEGLLSGCTRGVEGTAKAWQKGDVIARNFTAKDHNDMITAVTTAQQTANTATEAATAAQNSADNAQSTANTAKSTAEAALPKSGGVMSGTVSCHNVGSAIINSVDKGYFLIHSVDGNPNLFVRDDDNDSSAPMRLAGIESPEFNHDAANKLYVDSSIVRQNLADNSYYGSKSNTINQRGRDSYSSTGYSIDRWIFNPNDTGASLVVGNDYLTIPTGCSIRQNKYFPEDFLDNKLLTVSLLTENNQLLTASITFHNAGTLDGTPWGTFGTIRENNYCVFMFTLNQNLNVVALKIELGEFQTLAHKEGDTWVLNEIPDYATELLKCQRFYLHIDNSYVAGAMYTAREGIFTINIPQMRITPTAKVTYNQGVFDNSGTRHEGPNLIESFTCLRNGADGVTTKLVTGVDMVVGPAVLIDFSVQFSSDL